MNPDPAHDETRRQADLDLASRVRSNAGSAALGTVCLLFFGFYYFRFPTTTLSAALEVRDWFVSGQILLGYAMRAGGCLLGLVALASLTGRWPVLMADAVVSIPIGVMMFASAVLMLMGNGDVLQSLLLMIFGGMFIRAGWNHAQVAALARTRSAAAATTPRATTGSSRKPTGPGPRPHGNLAGAMLERRVGVSGTSAETLSETTPPGMAPAHEPEPTPDFTEIRTPDPSATAGSIDAPGTVTHAAEPPPEGFLAALAPRQKEDG